jgi:SAM-dependent methyltransferase
MDLEISNEKERSIMRPQVKAVQATAASGAGPATTEGTGDAISGQNLVKVYDSQGDEYGRAFAVFLAHTDQKVKATTWLEQEVNGLATREVFIDAGAGTGKLTAWLEPRFRKTIAIEPNPSLRDELQKACPEAELLPLPIAEARPSSRADFVLCSHVFYYIDRVRWAENLRYLADWLQPAGVLSVALQNHETDCMRMLSHFTGEEFDLGALARVFAGEAQGQFDVRTETVEAHVQTDSFESAYIIAEFVLNVLPLSHPPRREELEQYVRDHFRRGDSYHMSFHQDFLRIQRRA